MQRLLRTSGRATNDEIKGLVATLVLEFLKKNAFPVDQLLRQ